MKQEDKVLIRKFTLYMVDMSSNDFPEEEYRRLINHHVLGRISTNGHCLLKEIKRVGIDGEEFQGHPLNTFEGADDVKVWEDTLNGRS